MGVKILVEHCIEHCVMTEHLKEAPGIREQVIESTTKLKNYDVWIPKIEAKVDALFWKVASLNVGTVVVSAVVLRYLN